MALLPVPKVLQAHALPKPWSAMIADCAPFRYSPVVTLFIRLASHFMSGAPTSLHEASHDLGLFCMYQRE